MDSQSDERKSNLLAIGISLIVASELLAIINYYLFKSSDGIGLSVYLGICSNIEMMGLIGGYIIAFIGAYKKSLLVTSFFLFVYSIFLIATMFIASSSDLAFLLWGWLVINVSLSLIFLILGLIKRSRGIKVSLTQGSTQNDRSR